MNFSGVTVSSLPFRNLTTGSCLPCHLQAYSIPTQAPQVADNLSGGSHPRQAVQICLMLDEAHCNGVPKRLCNINICGCRHYFHAFPELATGGSLHPEDDIGPRLPSPASFIHKQTGCWVGAHTWSHVSCGCPLLGFLAAGLGTSCRGKCAILYCCDA